MPEEKSEAYLGSWADKEAAEKGLANLQGKMSAMGDETYTMRNQLAEANSTIANMQSQAATQQTSATSEAETELAEVQQEMMNLDDGAEDYHQNMMALSNKSNALSMEIQHNKTLSAARGIFTEELNKRDTKAIHNQFYDQNPDFNKPEMQEQIQQRIANDRTGITDSVSAYREIQRDEAIAALAALKEKSANQENLLKVAAGEQNSGNVETGNQTPSQTTQNRTSRADIDKEMKQALADLRG